jgi:beta-glucosidase
MFFSQRRTGRPADPKVHDTSKYIDIPVEPLFPFGHGLSYTQFAYRGLRVSSDVLNEDDGLAVEADIQNVGSSAGEETCFLFVRDPVASVARPDLELRGLCKLRLGPGEKGTAKFRLRLADLSFAADEESELVEAGRFEILAGPSAEQQRLVSRTVYVSKSTDIVETPGG